ncbi:DUF4405 domain-containing protein [Desulfobacter vibrioformis]|uniref:DUF4405 domain-containing protein n=1 Tax=Desulfobacter vibrioformis TaxID=34031 RepID=UPI0005511744|nr:DUF4405 domain-containing protein [Desulfobacter vibrioformis]
MKLRKITSLTMFLSFLLLIVTSVVLYVVPEGRVAYWSDWHFMGLTKTLWGDIHINLGVLFLISGLLHLYYNWKPMVTYMKNRAKQLKIFTPDFNMALAVTLIFTFGTLLHIPPMSTILDFSASFKDAGAQKYGEPPYGHAELSSLKLFAKRTGLDIEVIKHQLQKSNIAFGDESWTLLDIARANHCTPKDVYAAMLPPVKTTDATIFPDQPFPGIGRMRLKDLCTQYNLDTEKIITGLDARQIKAEPDQTIKEIAEAKGMEPQTLFEVIHDVVTSL